MLLLLGVIGREVWQIVQARRTGRAGARLHVRIVGLFSVIAAVPAILVAIVASITLDRGLDLFSTRTRAVIENSLIVAQAYLQRARADRALRHHARWRSTSPAPSRCSTTTATASAVPHRPGLAARPAGCDADRQGSRTSSSAPTSSVEQTFAAAAARRAADASARTSRRSCCCPTPITSRAVIKLRGYDDTYLYVARLLDPRVVPQLQRDRRRASANMPRSKRAALGVQVAFALMYTVIALIVLLSAVWIGLNFANRLVAPIRRLIGAANRGLDRQSLRAGAGARSRKAISPSSARPSTT